MNKEYQENIIKINEKENINKNSLYNIINTNIDYRGKTDNQSVSDNSRINSKNILDHVNKNINQKDKRNEINNINIGNNNFYTNSIENEITSIIGTQSSNNEKYDYKDAKDKSEFNNLNNLNNLIKISSGNKRIDDSDIIINNNTNTINTNNNVLNTKSNNSNFVLNSDNNSNVNRNIIYKKQNSNDKLDLLNQEENMNHKNNKRVNFSDQINEENTSIKNEEDNINLYNGRMHQNNIYDDNNNNHNIYIHNHNHNNIQNNSIQYRIGSYDENKNNENISRKKNKKENGYMSSRLPTKDKTVCINEYKCLSKKIDLKGLNIFDRLYKESEIKRIIPKKTIKEDENSKYARNNKINIDPKVNFGEILYEREKISKEEKERKLMQIKYEQDIHQMKNLTFTPEIHEYNVINLIIINLVKNKK